MLLCVLLCCGCLFDCVDGVDCEHVVVTMCGVVMYIDGVWVLYNDVVVIVVLCYC